MSNEWSEADDVARIPLQLARSCVVASIQIDLTLPVLRRFRADLLEFLQESGARAVILDLSGLMIMDIDEFDAVLMRKDPPVDEKFIAALMMLRCHNPKKTLVFNDPSGLLIANEKLFGMNLA